MRFKTFSLIFLFAYCPGSFALNSERAFGDWLAGSIQTTSGNVIYRAISGLNKNKSLEAYLAIDMRADCKTYHPNLVVHIAKGTDSDGSLNEGAFQARVDKRKIVPGTWVSSANKIGDNALFISLHTEEINRLVSDLRAGSTIRIKLEFLKKSSEPIFLKFSLAGSTASTLHALQLCRDAKKSADEAFFSDDFT